MVVEDGASGTVFKMRGGSEGGKSDATDLHEGVAKQIKEVCVQCII